MVIFYDANIYNFFIINEKKNNYFFCFEEM